MIGIYFYDKQNMLPQSFSRAVIKFKLCIILISLALFMLWIQFDNTTQNVLIFNENVIKEVIQNVTDKSKFADISQMNKASEDLKYMLIWNERNLPPLNKDFFRDGQESFILNKCSNTNCYVTSDRNYFGGDVTKFNAIAFNGRNVENIRNDIPKERSPFQKYIYFNMEPAAYFPVCYPEFDNFFNWTATYKLDSDIPFPYIVIKKDGKIVGPNVDMKWPAKFPKLRWEQMKFNKTKVAAWFVSRCNSRSNREVVIPKLQMALSEYGYKIDIYGACGPLKCPRNKEEVCNKKLEKDYYFYLSMENSLSEDYVTEKLLTALQHNVVPIVYGGADYSRFLPPESYIDARKHNPHSLAKLMNRLIRKPHLYLQYFKWKKVYEYMSPQTTVNVCKLCAALNDQEKFNGTSVYTDFRKWWLGLDKFKTQCEHEYLLK